MGRPQIAENADVHETADIGDGSAVWNLTQVRAQARIGAECNIGRGVYVGEGVVVGDCCKVQNSALLYEGTVLGDGVFVGPAVVFTNDEFPRAVTTEMRPKTTEDWDLVGVTVGDGASLGARSVVIAPAHVGEWALVGAGAVVTTSVPAFALVVGSPARRVGWVGHAGVPLVDDGAGYLVCPRTGRRYVERDTGDLEAIDSSVG